MLKPAMMAVVLLTGSEAALAQRPPTAGEQLRQIPPAPLPPRSAPEIHIDRAAPPLSAPTAGSKVHVTGLRVTGATLFAETELIATSGFAPGELDLADIRALAAKISAFYNAHGYVLAQAYVPAQEAADGVVTIAVVEGRYGAIDVHNRSRLNGAVASRVLSGLKSGDPVAIAPLERRLLLLSDIPGVATKATLAPGASVGTSDLIVEVAPGRSITGDVEGDNSGNRYTGAWRLGGTINFNNPTGHGDVASLRLLTSFSGLYYGRGSYQTLFGNLTVGVAFAHIDYNLGKEFDSLRAKGTADVASIYASYPLIRSRNFNLYALANVDLKQFHDKIGATSTSSRRHAVVGMLGLNGDEHDAFGGGGSSSFSISGSAGDLDIRSPVEHDIDALTARSDGGYGKVQGSAARLQTIAGPLSLYGSVRGQIAFDNLDSSEKMELGGAYGVRAYPEGEAYGDEGYIATAEARLTLPQFSHVPGRFQLIGFVDVGAVRFAQDPWFTGSNHAHRSGYGAGVNWTGPDGWLAKASYARKLGGQDATSAPDKSGRFWLQLVKLF